MEILILLFVSVIGTSFLCSVLESVLLSTNASYISVLEKNNPTAGKLLKKLNTDIDKSIASILILIPNKSRFGAILGFGTMFGAIISHIFILGINVNHDGGQLFTLAIITIICCGLVLFEERKKISIFQKS